MTGSAPCRILAWGCLLAAAAGCRRPTFFGGSGPEWGPDMEQHADFDDFRVWTRQPRDGDPVNR